MSDAPPAPSKGRSRGLTIALVSVGVLFIALIAGFVVIRLWVFRIYRVPSASMVPTITDGERVWAHTLERTPERGAVFVFPYPEHRDQLFVKRIVGLEGDVIEVKQSSVTINGWPIPSCNVGTWVYGPENENAHSGMLRVEWLGAETYLVFDDGASSLSEHQGPYKVAPKQFFVIGDNRNNSHDSRMWFGGEGGGVPYEDGIGRVQGNDPPTLPRGAEALASALATCLAKKPATTNPPPASH